MAYNSYYQPYGGYAQQNYYQQTPQQQQSMMQPQSQTSFVSIPNEDMVNTYPVGPGNCVTFKVEGKPIMIEKSMGFSQFDSPKIKRYRIVEEESLPVKADSQEDKPSITYVEKTEFDKIIDSIRKDIEDLKEGV